MSQRGDFVGYSDAQKAYQIYFPGKWCVVNSIHVRLNASTMMGGQFQADGEEQFHYNSLRSIFKPTKIKLKPLPTHSVPATPETILDEPTSLMRPSTPQTLHPPPSTPRQLLSANTPESPLTPLPPTPSPVIRVLNTGGVSTPALPTCTSNHLVGNHLKYSGIGNTDSWIPFPTSQNSAKAGGDSGESSSSNKNEGETETDTWYPEKSQTHITKPCPAPMHHCGKMLRHVSYPKSQNLGPTNLFHYPLATPWLDHNGSTRSNATMWVISPNTMLTLLPKDTPNAQALIFFERYAPVAWI